MLCIEVSFLASSPVDVVLVVGSSQPRPVSSLLCAAWGIVSEGCLGLEGWRLAEEGGGGGSQLDTRRCVRERVRGARVRRWVWISGGEGGGIF